MSALVKVHTLPRCDFCTNKARFDARTVFAGAWANMCPACFVRYTETEELGTGHGQFLFEENEIVLG